MGETEGGGQMTRPTVCTKCGNPGHNLRTYKGQGGAKDNSRKKNKRACVDERSQNAGQTGTRQKLHVSRNKRTFEATGSQGVESGSQASRQARSGGSSAQVLSSQATGSQFGKGLQQSRDSNFVFMRGLLFTTQPRIPKPATKGKKGAPSSQP